MGVLHRFVKMRRLDHAPVGHPHPAERFEAHDPPGGELDDRLVMRVDPVVAQGLIDLLHRAESLDDRRAKTRLIFEIAPTRPFLGMVEGIVGVLAHLLRASLKPGPCAAQGRRRVDKVPGAIGRLLDPVDQLFGKLRRIGCRKTGHDHGKFVTAEAESHVPSAFLLHALGNNPDQIVSGPMAERVVDHLQIVEIDQHQGPVAVPPRDLGYNLVEPAAVRQAGQAVGIGHPPALRHALISFHGNGTEMHAGIDDLPFAIRWPTEVAIVECEGAEHFSRADDRRRPAGLKPQRQGKLLVRLPVFMGIDVLDQNRFPVKGSRAAGADTMADHDTVDCRCVFERKRRTCQMPQAPLLVEQENGADDIVRRGLHFAAQIIHGLRQRLSSRNHLQDGVLQG